MTTMTITIDDFGKVEIKVGTVLEATKVPDADRLIQLIFDFGPMPTVIASEAKQSNTNEGITASVSEEAHNDGDFTSIVEVVEKYPGRDVRQVMSAIAPFFPDPSVLVGKQICVVTNLEPRKFRGYESQGMILAVDKPEGGIVLIGPESKVPAGTKLH